VKENIARFATGPGTDAGEVDAAVIAAARAIDAHDMIVGLPQGYDTLVGTGGTGLSGGQMQRIAIARALYGDPSIYFLDEPTAHLDADAQHAFVRLLAQLRRRGATVLIATHSADLLAATDRLLVLDKGRVARFGPIAAAPAQEARPPANFSLSPVTFTSWNARS
jgi:ATP-binding cassette subfamily C protein